MRGVLRDGRLRPRPRRGGRRRQDIASVGRGPSAKLPGGGAGSLFDGEDLDADKCLETAKAIKKANE